MGFTETSGSVLIIDSENAGFVAVKCQRLTVALEIAPGGFKIGESRLGINKQMYAQRGPASVADYLAVHGDNLPAKVARVRGNVQADGGSVCQKSPAGWLRDV